MDRLKWDSGICEEYLASLNRISRCLSEQIQQLAAARKAIMQQGVTAGDKTLNEILERLETVLQKLQAEDDRIRRLEASLERSMEVFQSVERKISEMGTDMMFNLYPHSFRFGRIAR